MRLSVAVSSRALPGMKVCGDLAWQAEQGGLSWAVLADGLGHGPDAAAAAQACRQALLNSQPKDPGEYLRAAHQALRRTRGAALSAACFDLASGSMAWAGVGNVEGAFFHGGRLQRLLLHPGIVGFEMQGPRSARLEAAPGDLLLLASDGLREDFARDADPRLDVEALAQGLLKSHGRAYDDATVLAARLMDPA